MTILFKSSKFRPDEGSSASFSRRKTPLIGGRVAKGNSGNGSSFRRGAGRALRAKHHGLLKQILCSGREVIPLIGLGERKGMQVRKYRDLWPQGGRESRSTVCTIVRELGVDKERPVIYLTPSSSSLVRREKLGIATTTEKKIL